MENLTALIKTFLRDEQLLLCIESLRKTSPALPIIVADDGQPSYVKEAFMKGNDVEYYLLPFNQGCPNGKNFLIDKCRTPFCLLGDDDFYYTKHANLSNLLHLMQIADLAGGSVIENGEVKHFEGFAHKEDDTLYLDHLKIENLKEYDGVLYKEAGFVFNFFIARVDALRQTRWDPHLKIRYEHEDFFLRFINDGFKVVYTPSSSVYHKYRPIEAVKSVKYDDFRHYNHADKIYFFNKWKITALRRYEGAVETLNSQSVRSDEVVVVEEDPLICPLPPIGPSENLVSCRLAAVQDGIAYWSRVYDRGDLILKQTTGRVSEREAQYLRQLSSEHFPRVLCVTSFGDYSTIAVEKIHGRRPEMCDPEINADICCLRTFIFGCLALLRQLRDRGITHRQIRLEHILLRDRKPVLLDLAWAVSENDSGFTSRRLERPPDGKFCDVYSMGKVLAEVSDRRRPAVDAVIKMMTDEYPALRISHLDILELLFDCACESDGDDVHRSTDVRQLAIREVLSRAFRTKPSPLGFVDCEAEKAEKTAREIMQVVPWNTSIILVDSAQTDIHRWLEGRPSIPMMERCGRYWGAPSDDAQAIRELERLRESGAGFVIFAWPALWWLDYYSRMAQFLGQNFRRILTNERVVIFDIRIQANLGRRTQAYAG
jgi:glycosyltransferase involved in cell wall biosynthesis